MGTEPGRGVHRDRTAQRGDPHGHRHPRRSPAHTDGDLDTARAVARSRREHIRVGCRRRRTAGLGRVRLREERATASSEPPPTGAVAAVPPDRPSGAPAPRRRGSTLRAAFASFEHRDFRYLGLSTLALGLGQWAQQIALAWLALELTGSAVQLGAISAFRGGVGTFTAPLGGYLADRFPRRMVIVWSTIASAVQALVFAALILAGRTELWHVYVLALAGGVIQSFAQPARQAYVDDITTDETLLNAVAMNSVVQNVARVAGPPLAGAVIGFWGTGALFVGLAGTQLVAVVFTLLIGHRTRQQLMAGGRGIRAALNDIGEGFAYSWKDRPVLGLLVVHTIPTLLVVPYLPFLAIVAKDVLHRGPAAYGQLASMSGWGALLGLIALTLLGDPKHKGRLMISCFVIYTGMVLVFAVSDQYALSLAALAASGVVSSVAFALNNTLIQVAAKNEYRGRVMAVWQLTAGLQPLGALPMGFLVQQYGPAIGLGSFMVAAFVAFLVFGMMFSGVRRM